MACEAVACDAGMTVFPFMAVEVAGGLKAGNDNCSTGAGSEFLFISLQISCITSL